MTRLPQVLVNVRVAGSAPAAAASLAPEVAAAEAELGATGRVLVRPSGTEPLVRVMVEAASHDEAERVARELWPPPLADRGPPSVASAAHVRDRRHPDQAGLASDARRRGRCSARWMPRSHALDRRRARPRLALDRHGRRGRSGRRACCGACPACGRSPTGRRWSPPSRPGSTSWTRSSAGEEARVEDADADGLDVEADQRRARPRSRTSLWALRRDRLRTAAAVVGARRAGRGRGRAGRLPVRPAGAVGHRPPGGAGPGLGRPAPVRVGPRARPRRSRAGQPAGPRAATTRCSRRARSGCADGVLVVRLQGGGRDRRARRQHRRAAGRGPRRRPAAPGPGGAAARGSRCSATPGGPASASSPSPTPTRSTARRTAHDRRAVRGRRAQRRRRQPRRPARPSPSLRIPAPITTDAKVIPALVSREALTAPDLVEAFRRTVAPFEGSVAIGAASAAAARPGAAGAAGQRPGAVRRPGRGPDHRGQRAVRAGRGDRPLPAHGRRDARPRRTSRCSRGQVVAARRPTERASSRASVRVAYDGTRAARPRGRAGARPRSRPATSTAATRPTSC